MSKNKPNIIDEKGEVQVLSSCLGLCILKHLKLQTAGLFSDGSQNL